jgi:prevent-host-death family protein
MPDPHRLGAPRTEGTLLPAIPPALEHTPVGHHRALTPVATCGYIGDVRAVAVRELKNKLSAYLREVARGEVVLVTDRGRVVAELRRPTSEVAMSAVEQALERLHAEGVLVPGLPQDRTAYRRTTVRLHGTSQALLDADRGER